MHKEDKINIEMTQLHFSVFILFKWSSKGDFPSISFVSIYTAIILLT